MNAVPRRATLSHVQEQGREARREAFREAVYEAARGLFEQHGFRDLKMADIAEALGVAKGTLYNYFDSKDEIFAVLAERGRAEFFASLDTKMAQTTGWDRLEALVRGALEFLERHARRLQVYAEATGLALTPDADPGNETGRTAYIERLQRTLAELREAGQICGASVEFLALALDGVVDAMARDWLRRGQPPGLADRTDEIIQLFARGVRPSHPPAGRPR